MTPGVISPSHGSIPRAFICLLLLLTLSISATSVFGDKRTGAWVDEVVVVEDSPSTALEKLRPGIDDYLHVYAHGITDARHYDHIRDHDYLGYELHLGTSAELAFNPTGPVLEGGELNPFAVPKIRAAMNRLVDRDYIAGEIYGGMAQPRWLPLNRAFSDYARLVDVARALERRYGHDPSEAEAIITEQMRALGAERSAGSGASPESSASSGFNAGSVFLALALAMTAALVYFKGVRRRRAWGPPFMGVLLLGAVAALLIPYLFTGQPERDGEPEQRNGKWHYEGRPVELRFLIRTDDERREIGDYVAGLLENIGFHVDRRYVTASEASPVWAGADPAQGRFHIYTGAWISTVVRRDDTGTFDFYYTPRGLPSPLWQAYRPSEEFDQISERLSRRDFESMEERTELFTRALELSLEDSVRIWLADLISVSPRRKEVRIAADLSGGISGANLWPYTLRIGDKVGGTARIGVRQILTDPWNPLDGSNWIFDMMFTRATSDSGVIVDPYTGLNLPQRIERATVVVQEGLPVQKTHDWVDLQFSKKIEVPDDAWIDWDAGKQRFITVGEKHPEGLTARRKSVAFYPEELYQTTWHDGSRFSAADIVLALILVFDRADEKSKLYDESQLDAFESFKRHFRGFRIKNRSPLVIETYSDSYSLDAENNVSTWYPNYTHGPGAWHVLGVGKLAEKAERLAFSNHKASRLEVEWMSLVAGPSLKILQEKLEKAADDNYIPYETVLGDYIDAEEARRRWRKLRKWHDDKEHFWVGTGPFYLEKAYWREQNLHLKRFEDHPDPADKWEGFEEPMMPEVRISGPRRISPGTEAGFEIDVSFNERPYPQEFVENVTFLWYDSGDELIFKGSAEAIEDGKWRIGLSGKDTKELPFGSNRLEAAVVSNRVSIPVFESVEFVVRP